MKEASHSKASKKTILMLVFVCLFLVLLPLGQIFFPEQTFSLLFPIGLGVIGIGILVFQWNAQLDQPWYRQKGIMRALAFLLFSLGILSNKFLSEKSFGDIKTYLLYFCLVLGIFCLIYSFILPDSTKTIHSDTKY
jgi:glucose uptake protein GlcU